ncbi:hypothetical protein GCM10009566_38800 [Streptomyces murinus]
MHVYVEQGRAEEGLTNLDRLTDELVPGLYEFSRLRVKLLVSWGRREWPLEEARARLGPGSRPQAQDLAELLSDAGRPEEAVALFRRPSERVEALSWDNAR